MTLSRTVKKNIKPVIGYTLFCLVVFVAFLYILFPRDEIRNRILYEIEKSTSIDIKIGEDYWIYPIGLAFKEIRFIKGGEGRTPLAYIDEFAAEIPVKSIFTLTPVSILTADLYGGSAKGLLTLRSDDRMIQANWTNIDLSRIEKLKEVPAEFAGRVSGDLVLKLKDNVPQGQLRVLLKGGKLSKIKVMGFPFPDVPVEELQGLIDIAGQTVSLQDIHFKSSDMKGSIKGTVRFLPEAGSGELDILIRFSVGEKMRKEYQGFLSFIEKSKDRSGFYNIKITGDFNKPAITI